MQIDWQQIRRLLVIFVGDIEIELTSLNSKLQTIRELTDAEITLCVTGTGQKIQSRRLDTPVDRLISYTTTWQDPAEEKEFVKKLSQFGFDAAIILTNFDQSPYPFAYLTYLAGIPIRIGRSPEFGGGVINYQLPVTSYQLPVK